MAQSMGLSYFISGSKATACSRADCVVHYVRVCGSYRLCYARHCTALFLLQISSVQFSWAAVSDSLWPHGLQHTRLPCPSPTPRIYLNSCPMSRWCHPTVSVIPFSCLQSFPASSYQVAKVLEFQLQHQSFQWIFRTDLL